MNDRIKQLQAEIAKEKEKMRNCKHEFGETFYNPDIVREGYGIHTVAQGSDVWSEFQGYRDVEKPRWTRKCLFCGFEEHANKQKPIISGYEPDFKN